MAFNTIEEMIRQAEAQNLPIWQYILRTEAADQDAPEEEIFENMRRMYQAMRQADAAYDKDLRSASGLSGGDGERLKRYNQNGKNLAGPYLSLVMEKAVKMGESNACMKRIVAAPTAGACGVIPAVLLSYEELYACLLYTSRLPPRHTLHNPPAGTDQTAISKRRSFLFQ